MGDMLSQEEIDALLSGGSNSSVDNSANAGGSDELSSQEMDVLGEIGNISMGTSATTLYALLGQKVIITTPQVDVCSWEEVYQQFSTGYVAVKVEYTEGLYGVNLLLLKENDAKIITDLMMGGDGSNTDGELTDLHLSAIGEAMNQMIGSAATSMSSIFEKKVDISPPKAFCMSFDENAESVFYPGDKLVKVAFKMVIGQLVDSEIMQLLPLDFAKSLVDNLMNSSAAGKLPPENNKNVPLQKNEPKGQNLSQQQQYPQQQYPQQQHYQPYQEMDQQYYGPNPQTRIKDPVNVQAAQFQSFDDGMVSFEKRNIGLIMDVPLQVTVELGRTNKKIRDILELGPGSIIELDKLAGEPVDILVNGKAIAKGEVVVIDESFGVRITDIIHPSKRL